MPLWPKIASFWRTLARGRRLDADLDEELNGYLDEISARHAAAGMDPATARRSAVMEIGGVEQVKEVVRDARIGRFVDETLRDIAYAWRMLRRAPGFMLAAVATLALGVGANTAIFSVINALLIAPLPYADPARLVFVWADQAAEGWPRAPLSGPELIDLDTRSSRFEGFGAIWATTAALTGGHEPEQLRVGHVTADFFSLLGASAAVGRTFVESDVASGPPTAILLSSTVWQRRYGGDPRIVGSRILVDGQPATVVGVMPSTFRLLMPPDASVPDDLEAWLPFDRRLPEFPRGQRFLRVIGRMHAGVSLAEGQRDVARVSTEISKAYAHYGAAGRKFDTVSLPADSVREIRGPLLAAFGGVAILLLIACVNVASLLIARAAARARETAVRVALGAGYGRLARQHLVEGMLLTAIGAAVGIIAGHWGLSALLTLAPPGLSRLTIARIDSLVILFTLGVMLVWGIVLSLAPLSDVFCVRVVRPRAGASARPSLRSALISGQIALSVVLVVGALLLVRTFINIQSVDAGFSAGGIYSFRVAPKAPSYEAEMALGRRLQSVLAEIPGVTGAASVSHAPYDHVPNWGGPYVWEQGMESSTAPQADYRSLSPGALELMGIRLIEGRSFTEDDDLSAGLVVLVDARLAARAWPGQSPIGRAIGVDAFVTGKPDMAATVVGVVGHVRHRSPVEDVRDQVYFSQRQVLRNPSVYVVRTIGDPAAIAGSVRRAVQRVDATLPIYDARPLSVYVDDARATRAFTMQLAVLFAVVALVLAAVGIYGVIAYSVATRQREFGVRRALGAQAGQVMTLVARDAASLVTKGVAAGVVIAIAGAWFMRGLLFGVEPWDAATYAIAISVLVVTGAAACLLPARRATTTNPVDVLRAE